jgi:hypothetical protein
VAITFDGWTSSTYRGYYPVTCHFVDDKQGKVVEILLDFFFTAPGTGVSKRCAEHIFGLLESFGLANKTLAFVSDNGSDAVKTGELLSDFIRKHYGPSAFPKENLLRCFVHTLQIGIKKAMEITKSQTEVSMKFQFNM